jgi:hypothetical protein
MDNIIVNGIDRGFVFPRVYTRVAWSDPWEYIEYVYPSRVVRRLSPEGSAARLEFRFGRETRYNRVEQETFIPLDPTVLYIRITGLHPNGFEEPLWYGFIQEGGRTYQDHESGVEFIVAHGLEGLFSRVFMSRAYCAGGLEVEPPFRTQEIDWAPTFNLASDKGFGPQAGLGTILPTGNKAPGVPPLFRPADDLASNWNVKDILDYMTYEDHTFFMPLGIGGVDPEKNNWNYDAPTPLVNQLIQWNQVWEQESDTRTFLDRIFDRRRGLYWKVRVDEVGGGSPDLVFIEIDTTFSEDVEVGTFIWPASSRRVTYTVPTDVTQRHFFREPTITDQAIDEFDEFIIRGNRIKVTATFDVAAEQDEIDGNVITPLVRGWSQALQDEYDFPTETPTILAPEFDDFERRTDRFRPVYAYFNIRDDWDWKDWEGNNLAPKTFPDGRVSFDEVGDRYLGEKRFLRMTSLLEAINYAQSPPVNNNRVLSGGDYLPMMAWVFVPDTFIRRKDMFRYSNKYFECDTMGQFPGLSGADLSPLDNSFGFEVRPEALNFYALEHLASNANTLYQPILNYEDIVFTATFETDQRQHIVVENPFSVEVKRRYIIDVLSAEYWWANSDTAFRVREGLLETNHADNQVLRDGLEMLEAVASLVRQWMTVRRQILILPVIGISKAAPISLPLGAVVTSVEGQVLGEEINTPVTGRLIDFDDQTTVTETGYAGTQDTIEALLGTGVGIEARLGTTLGEEQSLYSIGRGSSGSTGGGGTGSLKAEPPTAPPSISSPAPIDPSDIYRPGSFDITSPNNDPGFFFKGEPPVPAIEMPTYGPPMPDRDPGFHLPKGSRPPLDPADIFVPLHSERYRRKGHK